jgi:putative ABC transport system substrate-binding protein
MDRRAFIGTLTAGLLAAPLAAEAQPARKVWRVGILGNENSAPWEAFRRGLRDLGYVGGRNLTMESRWSEGRTERLPALAIELVQLRVDVIVASGTQAVRAAKQATSTIPIVMAVSAHPDKIGLVESLARPGGNVTGLDNVGPDLKGKQLQLLKEVAPKVSRVAVLWNPANLVETFGFKEMVGAAAVIGVEYPVDRRAHARRLPPGLRDRDCEPCRCLVCLR